MGIIFSFACLKKISLMSHKVDEIVVRLLKFFINLRWRPWDDIFTYCCLMVFNLRKCLNVC